MKIIRFAYISLLATLLLSCSKQLGEQLASQGQTMTLTASCDAAATKVMLDSGLKTVWNAGDSASVFYGGSSTNIRASYSGKDGAATGPLVFTDTARIKTSNTVAAVPYRSSNRLSGNTLYGSIPSIQYFNEGSYDRNAALLAASSPTDDLRFRYACAVLCLELKSYSAVPVSIQSITLSSASGECIAGEVAVDVTDPESLNVKLTGGGNTSIILSSSQTDVMCTIPAGGSHKFYFCAVPAELAGGYRYDVLLSNGIVTTFRNTASRKFTAGELSTIRCGLTQVSSIIIDFNELLFTPSLPTTKAKTDDDGVSHVFTNSSDGKEYSICAYSTSTGYYRTKVNGYYCLRFNGPGDYLKLPSIAGKRLSRFGAMVRQNSYKPMSVSSSKSSAGDIVPSKNYYNAEMTWSTVSGSAADAPLYLYMSSNNTQISRLELYFE